MRGAKPSSGLVHIHKSFIELHFAGKPLPQAVTIQAILDGKSLSTVLPGQVYATSSGQDHWLLGLQYVFKACKEPVITQVDMCEDNLITVRITSQGLQEKFSSTDPAKRAELLSMLEQEALKYAQAAVLRKEGRMQVSGPSINIPKKQLRAQWPEILDAHGPTDVTAHIFVDTADKYMSCAARITFTKAKAEPVFYLSGLSQLLKTFMGAFVILELLPQQQVVRVYLDTIGTDKPGSDTSAPQQQQQQRPGRKGSRSSSSAAAAAAAAAAGGASSSTAGSSMRGDGSTGSKGAPSAAVAAAAAAGTAARAGTPAAAAAAEMAIGRSSLSAAGQTVFVQHLQLQMQQQQQQQQQLAGHNRAEPRHHHHQQQQQQHQQHSHAAATATAAAGDASAAGAVAPCGSSSNLGAPAAALTAAAVPGSLLPSLSQEGGNLMLLAKHAAQLQALGNTGSVTAAAGAAGTTSDSSLHPLLQSQQQQQLQHTQRQQQTHCGRPPFADAYMPPYGSVGPADMPPRHDAHTGGPHGSNSSGSGVLPVHPSSLPTNPYDLPPPPSAAAAEYRSAHLNANYQTGYSQYEQNERYQQYEQHYDDRYYASGCDQMYSFGHHSYTGGCSHFKGPPCKRRRVSAPSGHEAGEEGDGVHPGALNAHAPYPHNLDHTVLRQHLGQGCVSEQQSRGHSMPQHAMAQHYDMHDDAQYSAYMQQRYDHSITAHGIPDRYQGVPNVRQQQQQQHGELVPHPGAQLPSARLPATGRRRQQQQQQMSEHSPSGRASPAAAAAAAAAAAVATSAAAAGTNLLLALPGELPLDAEAVKGAASACLQQQLQGQHMLLSTQQDAQVAAGGAVAVVKRVSPSCTDSKGKQHHKDPPTDAQQQQQQQQQQQRLGHSGPASGSYGCHQQPGQLDQYHPQQQQQQQYHPRSSYERPYPDPLPPPGWELDPYYRVGPGPHGSFLGPNPHGFYYYQEPGPRGPYEHDSSAPPAVYYPHGPHGPYLGPGPEDPAYGPGMLLDEDGPGGLRPDYYHPYVLPGHPVHPGARLPPRPTPPGPEMGYIGGPGGGASSGPGGRYGHGPGPGPGPNSMPSWHHPAPLQLNSPNSSISSLSKWHTGFSSSSPLFISPTGALGPGPDSGVPYGPSGPGVEQPWGRPPSRQQEHQRQQSVDLSKLQRVHSQGGQQQQQSGLQSQPHQAVTQQQLGALQRADVLAEADAPKQAAAAAGAGVAGTAALGSQQQQQQQDPGSCDIERQQSSNVPAPKHRTERFTTLTPDVQPAGSAAAAAAAAAIAAGGGLDSTLVGPAAAAAGAAGGAAAAAEWRELPDASDLLAVGKGLLQVMKVLGAGSDARLAVTRNLRVMSPQDREWLLSITYPHLQDSYRRQAVPEMCMILNEIAGGQHFLGLATAAAAAAPVKYAAAAATTGAAEAATADTPH